MRPRHTVRKCFDNCPRCLDTLLESVLTSVHVALILDGEGSGDKEVSQDYGGAKAGKDNLQLCSRVSRFRTFSQILTKKKYVYQNCSGIAFKI